MADGVFADGVLVDLNIRFWGGLARNQRVDVGLAVDAELPGFVVGLGMKRLIPLHYAKEWSNLAGRARYAVETHSFKFPVGAEARFVPMAYLGPLEEILTEIQGEFQASVEGFLTRYEHEQAEYLAQFPDHRDRLLAIYPNRASIADRFGFTWVAYTVALPTERGVRRVAVESVDRLRPESLESAQQRTVLAKYRDDLSKRFEGFLDEAVGALRSEAVKICQGIEGRLAKGEIITEQSLGALRRFFERFKAMNFVGDAGMAAELTRLDRTLADRSAKDLSAEGMREEFAASLRRISLATDEISDVSAVTGTYRRRIAVD
jgi:hypothetical protein